MYPILATRTSTISVRNDDADDLDYTRVATYRTDTFKGYGHLLEDMTLEEVLEQPDVGYDEKKTIHRALIDGYFPCSSSVKDEKRFLINWLVHHKQAKLLSLWLALTPLSIQVSTKEAAASLLAIVQSPLSFSGLKLCLSTYPELDIPKEIIPLLVLAFQANASLTKIEIYSDAHEFRGLSPLFEGLVEVAGLELITKGFEMSPADLTSLSNLLSRNKRVRVLELCSLGKDTSVFGNVGPEAGCAASVIANIAGQLQLERLVLGNIPRQCQAVIGELMCTSQVLKELTIVLGGWQVDLKLIDGFSRTTSVESVCLSMHAFEDEMLDLFIGIAGTNVSIKSLELQSRYLQGNQKVMSGICHLISRNRHLSSLTWQLPLKCKLDLAELGTALQKNIRLETLMLVYKKQPDDDRHPKWINETSISVLAEKLRKNCTLTELVLNSENEIKNPLRQNYSELQKVLDRNSAFQRYACSDAFLFGAVEGFFATMNVPADPSILTARALMHYKPRTGAAALALVNKTSYAHALFRRRKAHAGMLDQLLPITRNLVVNNRKEMIELLYGIIVTKAEFSTAELSRIAESETLPSALVKIMFRSPHDYLYLVQLFIQAVGLDKIRSGVTHKITTDDLVDTSTLGGPCDDFILSMLEQSFPPDQEHLLPFVEKELNYHAIKSAAAKLFVGYDIPKVKTLGSNKAELSLWCFENNQPGVLIAFYDACLSKVRIDFTKYSGAFARSMMNKISQLKNDYALTLEGVPDYEDALVLYRVLAGPSILKELDIDGNYCGPEFDFIMQGLSSNQRIKRLFLNLRTMSDPPAICDTLATLLEANSTIRTIHLELHEDDPELLQLTQLAAMDERLELEHAERTDDSSDSDEAPAQ